MHVTGVTVLHYGLNLSFLFGPVVQSDTGPTVSLEANEVYCFASITKSHYY